jgi:hypothetical protein
MSKCWKQEKSGWNQRWLCSVEVSSVWVHRTVRWCRLTQANLPLSGNRRRRTTINHRTVRWCTGLSGEPTVSRANSGRIRARRVASANGRKGHRTVSGAPSAPRLQRSTSPNKERNPHRTVSGAPGDRKQELPS